MLTLDKKELARLRDDVLENPEKYIKIFTEWEAPVYDEYYRDHEREQPKMRFHIQKMLWMRYYDDEFCKDTWIYKDEYETYKEWASKIDEKAIDTLRDCIFHLLNSIQEKD